MNNETENDDVKKEIHEGVAAGIVQVVGTDKDGNPIYDLTEFGKLLMKEIRR